MRRSRVRAGLSTGRREACAGSEPVAVLWLRRGRPFECRTSVGVASVQRMPNKPLGRRPTMVDPGSMTEPSSKTGYLFDRARGDQERLVRSSEALSPFTTEACLRAGLKPGERAIDVGCGPLGALIALAELVGSEGRVTGLDSSGE